MNRKTILCLGLVAALAGACDVVDDPYADRDDVITGPGDPAFNDTVWNDTMNTSRRILLEDFTGHTCPNCPEGTDAAKQLMVDFPNDVIVSGIHNSSSFSEPDPPDFPTNFETETGEKLRINFQIGSFPNGLINRTEFDGQFTVGNLQWENTIKTLLQDNAYMQQQFRVRLMNIYNTEERILRVIPRVEALASVTGEIFMVVYVQENGIIAPQLDRRASPSRVENYQHDFVLRSGFPQDGDGKLIFTNPSAGDLYDTVSEEEELRTVIDMAWAAENLEIIVFLVNRTSREIVQVEKLPLMNP